MPTSSSITFEDVHEYPGGDWYEIPNEDTLAWRELLKGKHIRRAAAICSSGEVGLFGILPTVREELVLVDHSYKSMHIAMVKYLILREKGGAETHRLLTKGTRAELNAVVAEVIKKLPKKIGEAFKEYYRFDDGLRKKQTDDVPSPLLRSRDYYWRQQDDDGGGVNPGIKREWERVPKRLVNIAAAKAAKVSFVHGDLTDLTPKGPFDLLYISNAQDHTNRHRGKPLAEKLEPVVRPGGFVICAYRAKRSSYIPDARGVFEKRGWKQVAEAKSSRPHTYMNWTQGLFQLPEAA